jgi:hypothetical protein
VQEDGSYSEGYSYFWNSDSKPVDLFYENLSDRLYMIYSDNSGNLNASYMSSILSDPVIWNGYRNGKTGFYEGSGSHLTDSLKFNAYIYPNPASHGNARLHLDHILADAKVRIFDIQGNLKKEIKIEKNNSTTAEILMDLSEWSSGVYICIAECGKKNVRFKMAIEK